MRWFGILFAIAACGGEPATVSEVAVAPAAPPDRHGVGVIEHEVRSDYSHLRVRKRGRVRTLLFVDDSGRERVQTKVDLERPAELLLPYTRMMFASYLVTPVQRRALIVGLGGGAMVHHARAIDPELELDVVEIDRAVIETAARLFDVRDGGRLHVHHRDAVAWLAGPGRLYDAIYLDAFLGAHAEGDVTGAPRKLRTASFLETVRARLAPGGVAVINLHHHVDHDTDLALIRAVFPQVYTVLVPGDGNVLAFATLDPERLDQDVLREQAAAMLSR